MRVKDAVAICVFQRGFAVFASIPATVLIGVELVRIRSGRAVVAHVTHAVPIAVEVRWICLERTQVFFVGKPISVVVAVGCEDGRIAGVAYAVAVDVRLVVICNRLTVVASVSHAVSVDVRLVGIRSLGAVIKPVAHAVSVIVVAFLAPLTSVALSGTGIVSGIEVVILLRASLSARA